MTGEGSNAGRVGEEVFSVQYSVFRPEENRTLRTCGASLVITDPPRFCLGRRDVPVASGRKVVIVTAVTG